MLCGTAVMLLSTAVGKSFYFGEVIILFLDSVAKVVS